MKLISLMFLVLVCGCTIPSRTYHAVRLSAERRKTIPADDFAKAVVINEARSPALGDALREGVITLARIPQTSGSGNDPYQPQATLNASIQQIIESSLVLELHRKGYRSGSRLNAKPTEVEKHFPPGKAAPTGWFKGSAMLLVTVNRFQIEPRNYEWDGGAFGRRKSWSIGTRVNVHFSVELVDAQSSESLWTGTVRLDKTLRGELSGTALLQDMVGLLVAKLPANVPQVTAN